MFDHLWFPRRAIILLVLIIPLILGLNFGAVRAEDAAIPIWQAGSKILDQLFQAQQSLFDAANVEEAASYYEAAAAHIQKSQDLYEQVIQPGLQTSSAETD